MVRIQEIPPAGDPSNRVQEFKEVLPRLLCCRYWWMSEWKSQQMSFPYWRLYWNRSGRARVVYNRTIYLEPQRIILIPPNTPFATDIVDTEVNPDQPYSLKGGQVESRDMEDQIANEGKVLHLFIHFTLGYPFDAVSPDIFVFDRRPDQEELVASITQQLMEGEVKFEQKASLELYSLLFSLLRRLPSDIWRNRILDNRVINGIRHMEKNNWKTGISNTRLAELSGMSVNAYARLFREQTGNSPRKYLARMRVEKACGLLHHSHLSIEQIAAACGFNDRYYFTRIFSQTMGISPGVYRRSGAFSH